MNGLAVLSALLPCLIAGLYNQLRTTLTVAVALSWVASQRQLIPAAQRPKSAARTRVAYLRPVE
jgi:hypothetical protein